MPHVRTVLLATAVALLAIAPSLAAGPVAQDAPPAELPPAMGDPQGLLPLGDGRDVVVNLCTRCHPAEKVVSKSLVRDDWEALLGSMITRGARLTDDEFVIVLDYMATHFPVRVNVNTAPAEEIAAAIGLRHRDAVAIVEYREQNGPYHVLEDLRKVPDIEFKRIQLKKEAVTF